jgi:predicted HAD superfamily hydrolase
MLLNYVRSVNAKKLQDTTDPARVYPRFIKELARSGIVSFDIFDTALLRYVDHPMDVYASLGAEPVFAALGLKEPVSRQRIAAEAAVRLVVQGMIGSAEVNLLEIYQMFCDQNGLSREQAMAMVRAEEQVELRLCFACAPIESLFAEAIRQGKPVIFISDSFHSEHFLARLLNANGYAVTASQIYSSATLRKTKLSGQLFPEVLRVLGVEANAILHVGDHPVSDYEKPHKLGVRCLLHPFRTSREQPRLLKLNGGAAAPDDDRRLSHHAAVRGLLHLCPQTATARGKLEDFWWKFGYTSAGPLTLGFCQWLEQGFRADGIDHAYFLMRDGVLLQRMYRTLFDEKADACGASLLYASRRAMFLPILEMAKQFAGPILFAGNGERPVREYLERLNVPAGSFETEARSAGFQSLDEEIDPGTDTRLLNFMVRPRVMEALFARGALERSFLEAYLEQEGVTNHRRVAVVDVGWSGTIHNSMHLLFSQFAPGTKLTGYYMGTYPMERTPNLAPDLAVRSYLMHRGKPDDAYAEIRKFSLMFDDIYSATEGSLLYFEPGPEGKVFPVLQAPDRSQQQGNELQSIHDGAIAFAEDYMRCLVMQGQPPLPAKVAAEEFFRVLNKPTVEEARMLGQLGYCDNLGSSSVHVAARLRATTNPAEMVEDFNRAHWKQGVLANPTEAGASLRTLVWLMDLTGVV